MKLELHEKIEQANKACITTDIKGKDYIMVNQRVKAFRMVYPEGLIHTEIISLENGVVTFKATVYDGHDNMLATGYAQEKEQSSFINKTSYIENCETSAVGRALGFCGFGIDSSIASYEEVANAMKNQEPKKETQRRKKEISNKDALVNEIMAVFQAHPQSSTMREYLKASVEQNKVTKVSDLDENALKALKALIDSSMKQIESEVKENAD